MRCFYAVIVAVYVPLTAWQVVNERWLYVATDVLFLAFGLFQLTESAS